MCDGFVEGTCLNFWYKFCFNDRVPLQDPINVANQTTRLIFNYFGLDVGFNETSTF